MFLYEDFNKNIFCFRTEARGLWRSGGRRLNGNTPRVFSISALLPRSDASPQIQYVIQLQQKCIPYPAGGVVRVEQYYPKWFSHRKRKQIFSTKFPNSGHHSRVKTKCEILRIYFCNRAPGVMFFYYDQKIKKIKIYQKKK
jgi:hypothetical protein